MAAFQRLFKASVVPAVAASAVACASVTVAAAEEGVHPGRAPSGEKLPIYSSPNDEAPITLIATPNPLTPYIATAREATTSALGSARSVVEDGVSSWIGFERRVEREVKSVIPKDETLTPGLIYVLVAGLTGSVLTRTRSFPVRFLAPPLFSLAALPYFLPKTAHNLRKYVSDVEDKHVPEFAASHDRFNQALELHWHAALDKLRGASDEARVWSSQAVHSVEEATGLKVAEAVRLGQDRVHVAKAKVSQAAEAAKEKIEEAAVPAAPAAPAAAPVVEVVEVQPIAVVVAPVEPTVEAKAAVLPVSEAEPVKVAVAEPVAPVAPAVPAAPATPAAEAKPAGDKPEKPRDVVAKPIETGGKRLV